MCKTMNAVHVDVWPDRNGCGKKKDFTNVQLALLDFDQRPTLYHGGGMNLRVRPREYNTDFGGGDRHVY